MYKLEKGKLSTRIKDNIALTFGFGTKKERMDEQVNNYEKDKINSLNHIMAERNLLISKVNAQIFAIDKILKPLEEYLNLYKKIEDLIEEEITKPSSLIPFALYKPDNSLIATGNYTTLTKVISIRENNAYAVFLVSELEKSKEQKKSNLINAFIQGHGKIYIKNQLLDNSEIYLSFKKMQQLLSSGSICNLNGIPINYQIFTFNDATNLKNLLIDTKNDLSIKKNLLETTLTNLNNAKEANESTLNIIEATKKIITTSPEYVDASLSDTYLKEYKKR